MSNRLHIFVAAVALAAWAAPAPAWAQQPAQAGVAAHSPNNYADGATWLCRPGRQDACAIDLATTVIAANGTVTTEPWAANPNAPIDCFYVYPTVSTDAGENSDMSPDPAELNVIRQQFARFGSQCRTYAPMYRQVTLTGLTARIAAGASGSSLATGLAYDDVRDAWRHYLQHDNQGRGVVLIGHSQGSFILTELIRQEIDGKPIQAQLISAMLIGATVPVAAGRDVGGAFQNIPLCRSATQTGCLISYMSFRSTSPPPENTLFGRAEEPGQVAACVNPAALGGGSGELHAYFDTSARSIVGRGNPPPRQWVADRAIETPWVSLPGLVTARCATNEHATFLEVTVHGNPADPRADDIYGDLTPQWGLHLVDMNLGMGNLLDIVGQQARAWLASRR